MKVFVDSDVVISSLLSTKGASYQLIQQTKEHTLFISNISFLELTRVANELAIAHTQLTQLIEERFCSVTIKKGIAETYQEYVLDKQDSHIVAGAVKSKAKFLVSYNMKDFKAERINRDFSLLLLTPGKFLQYLRSLQ